MYQPFFCTLSLSTFLLPLYTSLCTSLVWCDDVTCVGLAMQIQLAVLQSLTAHVAQFGDTAMEFLLQKVLMVLTYLHRRAPGSVPHQLQGLAIACFTALRAADTCEVRTFVAKLQAWLLGWSS